MYSEWASLESVIASNVGQTSVLENFPSSVGKDVASSIVKSLARHLSISTSECETSQLNSEKQVDWTMEVLWHGLGLPLTEHETIRDCVNVYCEWLSAMMAPKECVPIPVLEDPNTYTQTIIRHFYSLFIPRLDTNTDLVKHQVIMCHRVLRMIETVAKDSQLMLPETWNILLQFLLAINDTLLSPPTVKDGLGDQLVKRIVSVLFEMWLLACARSFPSPPMWKTFRCMCLNWRHHVALVEQWNRVNLLLTARMLRIMYGPNFPQLKISEDDQPITPIEMDNDRVAQSWFRFLHIMSNPVNLCNPDIVSQTPKFQEWEQQVNSEYSYDKPRGILRASNHSCLNNLPDIFLKAMKGISTLVDAFLGIQQPEMKDPGPLPASKQLTPAPNSTPPLQKKKLSGKNKPGSSSSNLPKQLSTPITPTVTFVPLSLDLQKTLATGRPKCNSILHLLGDWLFEAAMVKCPLPYELVKDIPDGRRSSSFVGGYSSTSSSASTFVPVTADFLDMETSYDSGRAEALGTLCRIFCSHKTGERILPVYYARFYIVLKQGLLLNEHLSSPVLSSILFNSSNLFRTDLEGIMVLLPNLVCALELVLSEKEPRFRLHPSISLVELRRASIHLLLSMLALPLHFRHLPIKEILKGSNQQPITCLFMRSRLVNLVVNALQMEVESVNTQMLLGGLLFCVQDSALCEEVDQTPVQDDLNVVHDSSTLLVPEEAVQAKQSGSDWSLDSDKSAKSASSLTKDFDTAQALFVRSIYLVCHRLISTWKSDLNISLAALELLSGIAKMKLKVQDLAECKRAVKWICDYIIYQCSRPPPAHSKDLHSTIVAAYQCVTTWLVEHSALLSDKECLNTVLEVVEMGISGSKSQPKPNDAPVYKGDKDLKPASMRVRDAAEGVLACILDLVGAFPSPSGPESLCSELNEDTLLRYARGMQTLNQRLSFRYFVVENSIILGILEQPLGNEQDPLPTVVLINRSPIGRHAWTMQLRQLPRHKSGKPQPVPPKRPQPMNDIGTHYNTKQTHFPESVDSIPTVKANQSLPTLESLIPDNASSEYNQMRSFIEQQTVFENMVKKNTPKYEYPNPETECKPPGVRHDFQTARLVLSHFGYLSLEALKGSVNSPTASLIALDSTADAFNSEIDKLDKIRSRTCDTMFVFYVRDGQKTVDEILSNITPRGQVSPHFYEFLRSLGWAVDVNKHPGWNGMLDGKLPSHDFVKHIDEMNRSHYDATNHILYWADHSTELAIIVPSPLYISLIKQQHSKKETNTVGQTCIVVSNTLPSPACVQLSEFSSEYTPGSVHSFPSVPCATLSDTSPKKRHSNPPMFVKRVQYLLKRQQSFPESSSNGKDIPYVQLSGKGSGQSPTAPPRSHLHLDLLSHDKAKDKSERATESPTASPDLASSLRKKKHWSRQLSVVGHEMKVMVVWLESFEDHENFPSSELFMELTSSTDIARPPERDVFIIFVHALQSGLFRIHMKGGTSSSSKISLAIPLVDGIVVSRRSLGTLVRQCVVNMHRRRRLDSDVYQPPHVKRRLKIQEICTRYQKKLGGPEFYTELFSDLGYEKESIV